MPQVRVDNTPADRSSVEAEIARLRDLSVDALRAHWHTAFGHKAPASLTRQLLFRALAYKVQADRFGDLDADSRRLLKDLRSPRETEKLAKEFAERMVALRPGTQLTREWNGRLHRVTTVADGFSWNNKVYPSLSKIASAITGTRWNGPRFFGLRQPSQEAHS